MPSPGPLTPAGRSQRARIAAHTMHAKHDSRETTKQARDAFLRKFEEEVRAEHPDLPEAEVQRRAAHLRKAHFARLAFLSAKARRRKAGSS